jgi:hypothetical protein
MSAAVTTTYAMTRDEFEREVDVALAGSFPASDPPPWTLGAVPPELEASPRFPAAVAPAAIDVVIAAGRGRRRAAGMAEAITMVALIPVAVLVAAAPIWGLGAAIAWLLALL